jgi:hypothetical protein
MDDFIELKIMYPVPCFVRCLNDPEVIKEARKELFAYAFFIRDKWLKEDHYERYNATWNT